MITITNVDRIGNERTTIGNKTIIENQTITDNIIIMVKIVETNSKTIMIIKKDEELIDNFNNRRERIEKIKDMTKDTKQIDIKMNTNRENILKIIRNAR